MTRVECGSGDAHHIGNLFSPSFLELSACSFSFVFPVVFIQIVLWFSVSSGLYPCLSGLHLFLFSHVLNIHKIYENGVQIKSKPNQHTALIYLLWVSVFRHNVPESTALIRISSRYYDNIVKWSHQQCLYLFWNFALSRRNAFFEMGWNAIE